MYTGTGLHETVVFIGFADSSSPTGIRCEGTGFLLHYKGTGYLVTVRHVAELIGSDPFVIRVNRRGKAELVPGDMVEWAFHPDQLVDLAAVPITLPTSGGFDCQYLSDDALLKPESFSAEGVGIGSLSYVIGLFRFIQGKEKNLPIVHAGNVALMPPIGEKIPVWNEKTKTPDLVEGYLIESVAINGASGSPVFARGTITYGPIVTDQGAKSHASWPEAKLYLLGVFQGAWFAPPDPTVAGTVRARQGDVVPVGVGIVVPAHKLIELLETPEMQENRTKRTPISFVKKTSVSEPTAPPAKDENPNAREDFTSLLGEAARKRPRDD